MKTFHYPKCTELENLSWKTVRRENESEKFKTKSHVNSR